MADAQLKIRIGSDISGAVAGTKKLSRTLGELKSDLSGLRERLDNATTPKSFAILNQQITETKNKILELHGLRDIIPEGSITEARANIQRLKNEIAALNTQQLKSPAGKFLVSELGVATKELKKAEIQAGLTAKAVGNPLTKSFGLLRQAAHILPGLGIAGIIGAITAGVVELVKEFSALGAASVEAGEDLSKAFSDAAGKAGSEQAIINSLISVARDETLSKQARTEAINKLNKEYDEFLPKLSLENINTQKVTQAVDALNESLLRQAKIKGVSELISKEFQKIAEAISNAPQENLGILGNIEALFKSGGNAALLASNQIVVGVRKQGRAITDAESKIKIFNETLKQLIGEEATAGTLFTDDTKAKKEIDFLGNKLKALEKIKKETRDIVTLTNLEEQIFDLKVKITLRDAAKNGLSKEETDLAISGFRNQLNVAFEKEATAFEAITRVKPVFILDKVNPEEEISSAIAKATGNDKEIKIQLPDVIAKFKIKIDAAENIRKQFIEGVAATLSNALQDTFSTLGATLGEALAGGNIGEVLGKAGQSFLSIIGGVLQDIGKQVVITSTLVQTLKKALNTLFLPGGASLGIGAGLALIAFGGLLKNFKFNIPKFAEGGIATGPTLGLFGEKGTEAIIPLDKLPSLIRQANAGGNINVSGRLTMNNRELVAEIFRAQNNFNRIN